MKLGRFFLGFTLRGDGGWDYLQLVSKWDPTGVKKTVTKRRSAALYQMLDLVLGEASRKSNVDLLLVD